MDYRDEEWVAAAIAERDRLKGENVQLKAAICSGCERGLYTCRCKANMLDLIRKMREELANFKRATSCCESCTETMQKNNLKA